MTNSEIKQLKDSQIEVKVSVSWDEWEKYIDQAAADYSQEIKIEGFRPGKAPRNMVEQKVGKGALLEAAAQKAIRETYVKVVTDEKLDVIGQPQAELLKLAEGNDLEYKIVTAVVPKATLKPWKKAVEKINKEYAKKKAEVSAEDVDKEMENIAKSRVQHVAVEREARDGDNVIIDFTVKQEGVPIENGTSKNHPLILGRGVFIPGFEDQVIGMKAGEEKEFELKFPEDYHAEHLAGKPAQFEVKVNTVEERKTPELSDEFAKSLGSFKDLADMRKSIQEGMEEEKKTELKEKHRGEIIDALVDVLEVDLPEVMIHEELHKMIGEFDMQLQGMGMTFDQYLQQIQKTVDDLEKEWEPQASKRIKAALALEEAAKEEEIGVTNEEVEEEMNKTLAQYKKIKDVEKNIDLGKLYNYVKGTLQNERTLEKLESLG
ncbi:MAG TPA: trigger factor [Patescibacteria group bacterium]